MLRKINRQLRFEALRKTKSSCDLRRSGRQTNYSSLKYPS